MNKICIGECIANFRREHGMTQQKFGDLLGVTAYAVSKWERQICYPDIVLLPKISKIIGLSVDEMLGKED